MIQKMLMAFLLATSFVSSPVHAADPSPAVLKEAIREVLKENPDLILDILREKKIELFEIVDQGVAAKRQLDSKRQLEAELKNPFQPAIDSTRPMLGEKNAPIIIVEYSDFQCSYCVRGAQTMKELLRRHPGKIRVMFKHMPLQNFARREAQYFEALARQDHALAWKFHDRAFAEQKKVATEKEKAMQEIVAALGADRDRLARDLEKKEIADRIDADMKEAQRFGLRGTPMFLINGVSVRGAAPIEEFERVMQRVEEKGRKKKG